jgi:hypothetical protein
VARRRGNWQVENAAKYFSVVSGHKRRIADPHLEIQLCQQSLEPAGIFGCLHIHSQLNSSHLQVNNRRELQLALKLYF